MSESEIQDKLVRRLFAIKKRPPLYLTHKSVLSLSDYYGGFVDAVAAFIPYDNDRSWIFNEFGSFIRAKYPELEYLDMFNILYEVSDHDEAKGFDLFFEEFESFLTEKGIEIPNFDKRSGG